MGGTEDGRPAHGSKQFGTAASGMDQVALRKAWFHGFGSRLPGKIAIRASAANSAASSSQVVSGDHLRSSGAASGAGFDVLSVYKDLGQLQKVNSGGGFVAETVQ